MAVSDEKQYEYLTSQCRYVDQKISDTFNLFIKLAITITGGVFFLAWKLPQNDPARSQLGAAANALMILLGISMVFNIVNYLRSWYNNRKAVCILVPDVPPPPRVHWFTSEAVLCVLIIAFCVGFIFVNPLRQSERDETGTQNGLAQEVRQADK